MTDPTGAQATTARTFKPFTVPATNASGALQPAGECLLGGWSFRESTGAAAAVVQLVDGGVSGGSVIAEIALPIGGTETRPAPGGGIWVRSGLSLIVVAGSVQGSVWVHQS